MKTPKWEKEFDEKFVDENNIDGWKTDYLYTKDYFQYPHTDTVKDYIRKNFIHRDELKKEKLELERTIRKEYKDRIKKTAGEFEEKYPTKTIGKHHYIRRRYLGRFLLEKEQQIKDELVEKIDYQIKLIRNMDYQMEERAHKIEALNELINSIKND